VICASCGAENQADARFCSACGARLEAEPPERESRKTVTILFCDVVRSTELGERLDPEALRRVMGRYFEAMRAVLERHGGTIEKFIGDAVMAVFGVPVVHEDDALRAVRAAIEMGVALGRLNRQLEQDMGITIDARIGVNTGPVVALKAGGGQVTGDAVNVCARLEQAAEPGTVLLGERTYRLVRDAVTVEPVDSLTVKGKSEALTAFRLISVAPLADAHARRLDSPMVGRQVELAFLRQSFERAVSQQACQLFTLLGSAGVGKSRLVTELLASVATEATVIRGRCLPYGEGITYWPIAEAVRQAAGILEQDSRPEAHARLGKLVSGPEADRVAPLVAEMIGLNERGSPQEDLFWAARMLLESLATERPLIAVIEDIHWAEPTLLDLIDYITDWSRDTPILLLCPARPELLDRREGWGGGKLNAASLFLEPLAADASQELIANILGGARLPAQLGARISHAAEGNPLFVEEMIGMLVDDGRLHRSGDGYELVGDVHDLNVPPTIEALLSSRLEQLSSGERAAAERGAVVGRVFELPAVLELSLDRLGSGNGETAQVRGDLMSLVRKELIRPERSAASRDESFRFRHQLIRDAAYNGLPKEERAKLHERFANWLEGRAGERITEYEEIVGYHLEQAVRYRREIGLGRADDRDLAARAGHHLRSAGHKAVARSDVNASINLISRALELLPPDDRERPMIGLELAVALSETGTHEQVENALEAAGRVADRLGDERLQAHVQVMGWMLHMGNWEATWPDEIGPLARRAIDIFEAYGDHLGLARAWQVVGDFGWRRGHIADEERAVDQALSHARAATDARQEAELMYTLSRDLVQGPTPVGDGIGRCEEILREHAGNRAIEGYMFHALAHLRARLGDFDTARDSARRYRAQLWESGMLRSYWFAAEVTADIEKIAGNYATAAEMLGEGISHIDGPSLLDALMACNLGAIDRNDEAEEAATRPLVGTLPRALSSSALAQVRARQGRLDEALLLSDEALATFVDTDFLGWHAEVLEDRAEVLQLAGRPAEAAAALGKALELYEAKGDVVSARRLRHSAN
jgi:class 3 adenylate cyclase/tetratricopeptide (TPR) repeat protein